MRSKLRNMIGVAKLLNRVDTEETARRLFRVSLLTYRDISLALIAI